MQDEEKVFSKKFIGIILGGIAAVSLIVYLVVINVNGGSSSLSGFGGSLDGTYYLYHKEQNVVISDNILKIDGKTALFRDAFWTKYADSETEGKLWRVDFEKQVIVVQENEYPYVLKDDILTFGYYNDDYVKKNSDTYKNAKKMTEYEYEEYDGSQEE